MKAFFSVVVGLSSVGVMGQGTGTSTNAKSYRAYTEQEMKALTEKQYDAIGVTQNEIGVTPTPDDYSFYNSFKFAQPNNYAAANLIDANGKTLTTKPTPLEDFGKLSPDDSNSPGFETWTGQRYKTWQADTWKDSTTTGLGEGYARREQHKDITKETNPSELDYGTDPAWNFSGIPNTNPFLRKAAADHVNRSGTIDYVYDEEDDAERWATAWAQEHYYPRSDYNAQGKRDEDLKKKNHYPLDDKSMGKGGDASYRHHHQELHQNGRAHYSHGLFPELHLDETHRYFMDGEAWPRTENEYRYSFKKWGNGYRAGTLVKEMNLEGPGKDVHEYQWGGYDENTTRGNQPDLFADAPNGGDQGVYTPLLDYSWTKAKYTALDAHTENTYKNYISQRPRLNGDDGNPAVKWHFDRTPYRANDTVEIDSAALSGKSQWNIAQERDMSVTSQEEDWDMKNSGVWGWDKTANQWKGWSKGTNDNLVRQHALPDIKGTLQTATSGDNNGGGQNGKKNPHKHNQGFKYAVGPTGHGLTTAVGDKYGWNTDETYGYGKLDTYRTWNMKGRKV